MMLDMMNATDKQTGAEKREAVYVIQALMNGKWIDMQECDTKQEAASWLVILPIKGRSRIIRKPHGAENE